MTVVALPPPIHSHGPSRRALGLPKAPRREGNVGAGHEARQGRAPAPHTRAPGLRPCRLLPCSTALQVPKAGPSARKPFPPQTPLHAIPVTTSSRTAPALSTTRSHHHSSHWTLTCDDPAHSCPHCTVTGTEPPVPNTTPDTHLVLNTCFWRKAARYSGRETVPRSEFLCVKRFARGFGSHDRAGWRVRTCRAGQQAGSPGGTWDSTVKPSSFPGNRSGQLAPSADWTKPACSIESSLYLTPTNRSC